MRWLTRTPIVVVRSCLAMIPRLQAEEALSMKTQVGVGTGSMDRADAKTIINQWADTASRGSTRAKATSASPDTLAGMGIGYRAVPPPVPSKGR